MAGDSAALPRRFPGGSTIACFSHAASVALVAALVRSEGLDEVGTFAPCGIWKLVSDDGGAQWRGEKRGDDNTGHVSENDPSTYSWGFEHSRSGQQCEDDWQHYARCPMVWTAVASVTYTGR